MRIYLSILLGLAGTAWGCDARKPATKEPEPQPAVAVVQPATKAAEDPTSIENDQLGDGRPHYGWYQTNVGEASYILIAKLNIAGLFEDYTKEIAIQRDVRVNAEGEFQLHAGWEWRQMLIADGRNKKGGWGYGLRIYLDIADFDLESDENSVLLRLFCYWTTPDQVRGKLDEKIPLKVGAPADIRFPNGCRLHVSWRKNA